MAQQAWLGIVCLLALFAGCTTDTVPTAAPGANPDPASGAMLSWNLEECRWAEVMFPADLNAVRAMVPAGIEPRNVFGTAGLATGRAGVVVEAAQCASGAGLNETLQGVSFAAFGTPVHPPKGFDDVDADDFRFQWDVLIPDEARGAVLRDGGVSTRSGEVVVGDLSAAPADAGLRDVSIDMAHPGFVGWDLRTGQPGDARPEVVSSVRFMAGGQGSLAIWQANLSLTSRASGWAAVELPTGSYLAELAGGEVAAGPARAAGLFAQDATVRW